MKKEIETGIQQLERKLEDTRTVIIACNDEIESGELVPNELQEAQLKAIAEIGKKTIEEINRLTGNLGSNS